MTTTRKELLSAALVDGSSNPIISTEMNSLNNNALVLASVYNSNGVFSNVQGDSQGDGKPMAYLVYKQASTVATAYTANTSLNVWWLTSYDSGTTYESGSSSITPARNPDAVIPLIAQTAAQTVKVLCYPPVCDHIKTLVLNSGTGQSLPASGNTLSILMLTDQLI